MQNDQAIKSSLILSVDNNASVNNCYLFVLFIVVFIAMLTPYVQVTKHVQQKTFFVFFYELETVTI